MIVQQTSIHIIINYPETNYPEKNVSNENEMILQQTSIQMSSREMQETRGTFCRTWAISGKNANNANKQTMQQTPLQQDERRQNVNNANKQQQINNVNKHCCNKAKECQQTNAPGTLSGAMSIMPTNKYTSAIIRKTCENETKAIFRYICLQ